MKFFRVGGLPNNDARTSADHTQIRSISLREITSELVADGHANAAATSASNAAASETEAGSFAAASSASATNASTSASSAETSASQSSVSAGSAAASATTATNQANAAAGSASSASTSAAQASDSAIQATNSFLLSAQISTGAINQNANFANYTNETGRPELWDNWIGSNNAVRVDGQISPYAYQLTGAADGNRGMRQFLNINATGFYQLRATVTLVSGTFEAAALWAIGRKSDGSSISNVTDNAIVFTTDPDSSGNSVGNGVVGQTYTFTKIIHITDPDIHDVDFRVINHSTTFGSIADENVIAWHEAVITRANSSDIGVQTLSAEVSQQSGAIADLTGYAGAYHTVQVGANGEIAGIALRSATDGTVSLSDITLSADRLIFEADGEVIWFSDANGLTMNKALRWVAGGTANNPDTMYVIGLGFGANSDLMDWFGPFATTVEGCTRFNGIRAKTVDGRSYLAGTLEGGSAIMSSKSSTGTVVEETSIGANGNITQATASFSITRQRSFSTNSNLPNSTTSFGSATLSVSRREGSGSYVQEASITVSGTITRTVFPSPDPNSGGNFEVAESFVMNGSFTHEQQSNAAQTYDWRSQLSSVDDDPPGAGWSPVNRSISISIFEPAN